MMLSSSTGNVGIGTASPNWKLHVMGELAVEGNGGSGYSDINLKNGAQRWHISGPRYGEGNRLGFFWNDGTSYYDYLTLTTSGNVGIGTSSPNYVLSLQSTSQNMVSVKSSSHSIVDIDSGPGLNSYLKFTNNGVDKWDLTSETTGNLRIYDYGSATTRMVVTPSSNVGIGTTSPSAKLNVYNSGGSTQVVIGNSNTASGGFTSLGLGTSADANGYSYISSIRSSGSTYGDMILNKDGGNVGIGTTSPDAKLAVSGQVHAQEVKVSVTVPGPDYVFEKDYKLPSLEEIKNYIDQNKHLPEVPSAKEMEKNGMQLGEMNMLLLKKIEELTLHMIEMKRENAEMKKEINDLKTKR